MPTALSQVDFFVHALYAQSIVAVDIPFEASNDWMDIVPGLSVQIDQVEYEGDHYHYHVKRRHFDNKLATGILTQDYLVSDFALLDQVDIICNMDFVDQKGNVVAFDGPRHISESSSDRGWATVITGNILFWTQDIEFMRFTIALEPYPIIVPLTLTDIPISSE